MGMPFCRGCHEDPKHPPSNPTPERCRSSAHPLEFRDVIEEYSMLVGHYETVF
jgi:hypothetical protein